MEDKKPRRRSLFQWSLLTLLIVVMLYGSLWTVTAKFGVAGLKEKYKKPLSGIVTIKIQETDRGFILKNSLGQETAVVFGSPAPFLVSIQFGETTERYYWFFGCSDAPGFKPIEEQIEPLKETPLQPKITDNRIKSDVRKDDTGIDESSKSQPIEEPLSGSALKLKNYKLKEEPNDKK